MRFDPIATMFADLVKREYAEHIHCCRIIFQIFLIWREMIAFPTPSLSLPFSLSLSIGSLLPIFLVPLPSPNLDSARNIIGKAILYKCYYFGIKFIQLIPN